MTLGVLTGRGLESGRHLECGNVLDLDLGDAYTLKNYPALQLTFVYFVYVIFH